MTDVAGKFVTNPMACVAALQWVPNEIGSQILPNKSGPDANCSSDKTVTYTTGGGAGMRYKGRDLRGGPRSR